MKHIYVLISAFCFSINALHADIASIRDTNDLVSVTSYTDGNGMFTYTLSGGTNAIYRFRDPTVHIEASFVTSTESPVGWNTTLDSDTITWEWTGAEPLIVDDTPFTFTVYSSKAEWRINDSGIIAGDIDPELTPDPNTSNLVGYNKFFYIQPIPEPTTISFMATACGLYLFRRRIRK